MSTQLVINGEKARKQFNSLLKSIYQCAYEQQGKTYQILRTNANAWPTARWVLPEP